MYRTFTIVGWDLRKRDISTILRGSLFLLSSKLRRILLFPNPGLTPVTLPSWVAPPFQFLIHVYACVHSYVHCFCRSSNPDSGQSLLSNAQIAEHYSNCIKLSSENVSAMHWYFCCVVMNTCAENQCKECIWATSDRSYAPAVENERWNDKFSSELMLLLTAIWPCFLILRGPSSWEWLEPWMQQSSNPWHC